jgi:heterogeneous nuclear ribonucleoprotein A1/A3
MLPGVGESNEHSPVGEKRVERRLEDLLPRGRRAGSASEHLGRKIFVGGLNPKTTSEAMREYFAGFGAVADSCVIADATTQASRGFGFVVFEERIPEGLFDKQHIIDQRRCGVREYSQ